MKKKNVMIITAAVLVCAITITGIARAVRGGGSAVDVTQVSYLNSGWWDEALQAAVMLRQMLLRMSIWKATAW